MKKGKDLLNAYLDGLKNGFSSVCTVFTSETINSTYGKTNSSCHLKDSTDFTNFIEKHEQNYLQTHGNPMGTENGSSFCKYLHS